MARRRRLACSLVAPVLLLAGCRDSPTVVTSQPVVTTAPTTAPASPPPPPPPGFVSTTAPVDSQGVALPRCQASMFEATLRLDKASYPPGEVIYGASTFRNVSGGACFYDGANVHVDVLDSQGQRINAPSYSHIGLTAPVVVAAAQEVTRPTPLWDQTKCVSSIPAPANPCRQAAAGLYRVVDVYEPFGSAAATVQLAG